MTGLHTTSADGRYRARPARPDEFPVVRALWHEFVAEQRDAGFCENNWELPDVIDAFDARLEASVTGGLVAVLEATANPGAAVDAAAPVVGFLAGLDSAADSRIPADAVLVTDLYLQAAHRHGANGLPLYPCLRQQSADAGKLRLLASTHDTNRLVVLVMKRLGFRSTDALPYETPGHSWWELHLA